MGVVLPLETARALRNAGLVWDPRPGDRFAVPDRDLDGQSFVISDMVISTLDVPGGPPVLAFNGTTEWALDSLDVDEAVWLPREDQLRELLGPAFRSLERVPGVAEAYAVSVMVSAAVGTEIRRHLDLTPEASYARAVLDVLTAQGS